MVVWLGGWEGGWAVGWKSCHCYVQSVRIPDRRTGMRPGCTFCFLQVNLAAHFAFYRSWVSGWVGRWLGGRVVGWASKSNFSLDGKTPGRSHLRRGDHIYPRAITSCPGHALCLTRQVKCTCPGDHIHACCNVLHGIATPGTRHECDRQCIYI